MYRIEVAPGEETVFRTIEELAIGIRNGVITQRARIYHHASQKWLPIGLHPHYKKALELPAASASPAPVIVAAAIPTPSRLKANPTPNPVAHSQPRLVAHPPEPKRSPEPKAPPEPMPVPKIAAAPRIPPPVQSPVIAMQNEVLRDLPVISIPEPLPWNVKPPQPAPPVQAPTPAVHTSGAHAPTYAPATHAPGAHAPRVHARVAHAPVAYAPLEFSVPVTGAEDASADGMPLPHSVARRPRRIGGRPIMLLGAAAALVICTHLVLTATPSAPVDPSDGSVWTPTEEPEAAMSSTESRAAETPRVTIAPARVPMTPGPAFAGSVPSLRTDSAAPPRTTTPALAPVATAAAPIAPAPAALEMALPDLDSVAPTTRTSDTLGMKKILRALNGSKPPETAPTP